MLTCMWAEFAHISGSARAHDVLGRSHFVRLVSRPADSDRLWTADSWVRKMGGGAQISRHGTGSGKVVTVHEARHWRPGGS
jgi:hypothetical protein